MDMSQIDLMMDNFERYLLLQRNRAPATADGYVRDAKLFVTYLLSVRDDLNLPDLITVEKFQGFVIYLRGRGMKNSTITRRLIGVQRFWKFLYKRHMVKHPPETLDDMDIVVKKVRNCTEPLSPINYAMVRKAARDGLRDIR